MRLGAWLPVGSKFCENQYKNILNKQGYMKRVHEPSSTTANANISFSFSRGVYNNNEEFSHKQCAFSI